MRFIHTADWQIGKVFRRFGGKEAVLQQARLDAIDRIGALALAEGVAEVLVAGDVYDHEAPSPKTLAEPLERMRAVPKVRWHLLPGNHDPHRPQGLWDRALAAGLPSNVVAHLEPRPFLIDDGVLLPAPLARKRETRDLTAWMDQADSAPGLIRIGLAHGSVTGFGGEGEAGNPIDPGRPAKAGLSYLALGDWHRTVAISPAVRYAGTPEPDRFDSQEQGRVLLVDVPGPGAEPKVEERLVGRFRWTTERHRLDRAEDADDLDRLIRGAEGLSSTAMRLVLEGALPLAATAGLDAILARLEAAMFWLDVDRDGLAARPAAADLEAIDFDGVLRRAADELLALSADPSKDAETRRQAEDALVALYVKAVGLPGGGVP